MRAARRSALLAVALAALLLAAARAEPAAPERALESTARLDARAQGPLPLCVEATLENLTQLLAQVRLGCVRAGAGAAVPPPEVDAPAAAPPPDPPLPEADAPADDAAPEDAPAAEEDQGADEGAGEARPMPSILDALAPALPWRESALAPPRGGEAAGAEPRDPPEPGAGEPCADACAPDAAAMPAPRAEAAAPPEGQRDAPDAREDAAAVAWLAPRGDGLLGRLLHALASYLRVDLGA